MQIARELVNDSFIFMRRSTMRESAFTELARAPRAIHVKDRIIPDDAVDSAWKNLRER
jgi:hypothetical protein